MDDRLGEAVERLSEADFERLCDAEMAKVDAMMAELRAAVDEDRWPREYGPRYLHRLAIRRVAFTARVVLQPYNAPSAAILAS